MHPGSTLTEIAIVVVCALICGLVFTRFRQPAILGYLLAGIVLGPTALGLVENRELVSALAELGVLMLLFLVGMELNLRAFREVWATTLSCVLLQLSASFLAMFISSFLFHWSLGTALLISFIVALSSTAVAVKMLESIGELKTDSGRLTISILIAQDLAFVPMILIVRSMGSTGFDHITVAKVILSIAFLVGLSWYLSRKDRVHIPFLKDASKNPDLLPILGLTFCFGTAALSGLLGISAAYGAFLAGIVLGNSAERHEVIESAHPIQATLMMIFFLSVGLLVDVPYLWENIGKVALLLFVVFLCKTALNVGILRFLKQPLAVAFLSSLMLSQIGEFSFLLASIGTDVGLLDETDQKLVISLTVLSLAFSPIWMQIARRLRLLSRDSFKSVPTFLHALYTDEKSLVAHGFEHFKVGCLATCSLIRKACKFPTRAASSDDKTEL
jgi:CPA2 family monovalent cation:H+ antiporter-2